MESDIELIRFDSFFDLVLLANSLTELTVKDMTKGQIRIEE